jgi:hypothetical protein
MKENAKQLKWKNQSTVKVAIKLYGFSSCTISEFPTVVPFSSLHVESRGDEGVRFRFAYPTNIASRELKDFQSYFIGDSSGVLERESGIGMRESTKWHSKLVRTFGRGCARFRGRAGLRYALYLAIARRR